MEEKKIIVASYNDDLSFLDNEHLSGIPYHIYEKGSGNEWKQSLIDNKQQTMKDFAVCKGYHELRLFILFFTIG